MRKVLAVDAPVSRPASAVAADIIREAVVDGRLAPGERLKEETLAAELGISRTPIREALLVLQSEGIVDAVPNRGAFVRAYEPADLEDMYELRAVLEGYAASRAARFVTEEQLTELRASCERFDGLVTGGDVRALVKENMHFHATILEAARNERLRGMVRQVIALPLVYKSYVWYSPDQARASAHAHHQLTNALEQRDSARAELVMREHVYEGRDVLAAHLRDLARQETNETNDEKGHA